jgi:hypothetical protein
VHGQTFDRRIETFPTEADAKQFAKEMLAENHHIFAGTLLGAHLPERCIISGSQLYSWVGVEDPTLSELKRAGLGYRKPTKQAAPIFFRGPQ